VDGEGRLGFTTVRYVETIATVLKVIGQFVMDVRHV
jgi:hypothetical protein